MTSLEGLCSELGVDVDAARSALRAAERDETAWYVQLVLGIGAWLTAIIGLFLLTAAIHTVATGLGAVLMRQFE